jgi:3-hydroxyisobutyrate dehydrogenase-like beta-hydroxyacid dehydrogenase
MKIGFIGLGEMGLPMAKRILNAGYDVCTAPHRRRQPADELAALGARVLDSPAEVASATDLVITIVPADGELRETVFGPQGLVEGLSPGNILIDMTTCTAETMREVHESLSRGEVRVLDAPVSGGTVGAVEGKLTIMVGGDAALLEECRPVLSAMGTKIVHVGAVGQGKVVKMVNQMMAAIHMLTIGEAFALGVRCGADPATLYDVIKDSSGYSKMMDGRLKDFLMAGSYKPGFKLDLMKKDVNLALESGKAQKVPLLLTSLAAQVFAAASAAGDGASDFSAAAAYLARMAQADLTGGKA